MNARRGMLNRAVNSLAFHSLPRQSRVIRRPRRRRRRHGGRKRDPELLERGRVEGLEMGTEGGGVGDRGGGSKSDQFISAH